MAKKEGFFNTIARVVTGKTAEQRQHDADVKRKVQMLEQQAYEQERLRQAPSIGQAKARVQAKARIKQLSQPKPQGGLLNLGTFGKPVGGFDALTFGSSSGAFGSQSKQPKVPSPMDVANMQFTDYSLPKKSSVKSKLKKRKKRR